MFTVWYTTTGTSVKENPDSVSALMGRLEQFSYKQYKPAASPERADAIIFIEPNNHKFWEYPHLLLGNSLIKKYPNKCFAYDYTDSGTVFLPGAYVCMPEKQMNKYRTRAAGYYGLVDVYNSAVTNARAQDRGCDNIRHLYSFRGSMSHPVREKLVNLDHSSANSSVQRIQDRWFNHSMGEQESYVQEILQSKFVLAPRGIGTASIRLFETMQLRRAPVIISDDWVAPNGPEWDKFSIRVPECRISDLPRLIQEREPEWKEMGEQARYAWEQYYAPDVAQMRLIESIESLMRARPVSHDERDYHAQWTRFPFAWSQNWTFPQRMYHKANRTVFERRRVTFKHNLGEAL